VFTRVARLDVRAPRMYLVKIRGDSTQGEGIYRDDLVIVDPCLYDEMDDIGVAAWTASRRHTLHTAVGIDFDQSTRFHGGSGGSFIWI
jgi:SOS-response transcriptional repressor LexA